MAFVRNKMPGQNKTFALRSPADFLLKLIFEMRRLREIRHEDNPAYFYQAITAASDAWHMADWVFHALPEDEKKAFGRDFHFRNYVRGDCRPLAICREIADAAKHSHLEKNPEPQIKTSFILGLGTLADAPTNWLVVDGEDIHDISSVVADAADYWVEFLKARDMLEKTPLEDIYGKDRALL